MQSLRKGEKYDLTKNNLGLKEIEIALGWSINSSEAEFDVDASLFMLDSGGKCISDNDIVFYGNKKSRGEAIAHFGTEISQGVDKEKFLIDLDKVPGDVERLSITVTIYDSEKRKQDFSLVDDFYIKVLDKFNNNQLVRFDLGKDFSKENAVIISEIYRYKGEWKFVSVGSGYFGGLEALCKSFGIEVKQAEAIKEETKTKPTEPVNLAKQEAVKKLDLRKQTLRVSLEKKSIKNIMARVAVVMDKSGSMRKLYMDKTVQDVLERFFPIALKFDDNGELDVWLFHNDARRLEAVTEQNFHDFVDEIILKGKYGKEWRATSYAPVIKDVMSKYLIEEPSDIPTFVIFVTDGNNDDKNNTKKAIIEASKSNIFWQFIGIGDERFDFLKRLDELDGRTVDNANFFEVKDISTIQDNQLYDLLLNEYPIWEKEAKKIGIIK